MRSSRTLWGFLLGSLLISLPGTPRAQDAAPSPTHPQEQIDLLLFEGELQLEEGKLGEAIVSLRRVVELDPARGEARLLLARALTSLLVEEQVRNREATALEALGHYRWILEGDPEHAEAKEGARLLTEYAQIEESPMATPKGERLWSEGREAMAAGEIRTAIRAFERAAGEEPEVAQIHRALGDARRANEDYRDAIRAYERALELEPGDGRTEAALGQTWEVKGNSKRALEHYREAFLSEDTLPVAYEGIVRLLQVKPLDKLKPEEQTLLGRARLMAGDNDGAVLAFTASLQRKPTALTRKFLGIAVFYQEKDDEAIEILTRAHEEDPEDPETLYYIGAAQLRQGRKDEGRTALRKILETDPHDVNALRLLGLSLADEPGAESEAIIYLRGAEEWGADIDALSCILGTLYLRTGSAYEAHRRFRLCLDENPDYDDAYLGLGVISDDLGRTGDAISFLETYLDRAEEAEPAAFFRLAVAYLRSGQDEKGYQTLRRVMETNPPPEGSQPSDLQLLEMTSFFLASARRFDDAGFIGEMLLSRDPENAVYNNNLAMTYADAEKNLPRALQLAEKANRLTPDNPGHLDTLGWTLLRLDRLESAEETLLKSIRLAEAEGDQNFSEIYYHLGYLYQLLDQPQTAEEYLSKALENPPNPFIRGEVERLLESGDKTEKR